MELVIPVVNAVNLALSILGALAGAFAAADALSRRPDAFAAADRQTKGVWAGVTTASGAVLVLSLVGSLFAPQSLLWLAAVVGTLVYLLDVRPKLREVQRGTRW